MGLVIEKPWMGLFQMSPRDNWLHKGLLMDRVPTLYPPSHVVVMVEHKAKRRISLLVSETTFSKEQIR